MINYLLLIYYISRVFGKSLIRNNPLIIIFFILLAISSLLLPKLSSEVHPQFIVIVIAIASQNLIMNIFACKEFNLGFFSFYPVKEQMVIISQNIVVFFFLSLLNFLAISILVICGSQPISSIDKTLSFYLFAFLPLAAFGNLCSIFSLEMHRKIPSIMLNLLKSAAILLICMMVLFLTPYLKRQFLIASYFISQFALYMLAFQKTALYFKANRAMHTEEPCTNYL
jgi:hypothetical protein